MRAPTDRAQYRCWVQERCRYGDTDRQGHVNNAVFATFAESGRVALLHGGPGVPAGHEYVIVRLTIDFRAELLWGDTVDIGTTVISTGNSSFTVGQAMFRCETCVATTENVLVLLDSRARRSAPLPDAVREYLAAS